MLRAWCVRERVLRLAEARPFATSAARCRLDRGRSRTHERSDSSYGATRILEDLREAGHRVGQKRIAHLIRDDGLQGVSKRRGPARPRRETLEAPPDPDFVKRAFLTTAPNQLRVANISYPPDGRLPVPRRGPRRLQSAHRGLVRAGHAACQSRD
ncbi:MAG: IS3 family transposase [Gemmatimonadaceae bacterium]|nr:IS3 family transposase [Gemmatimonadaceae bacterium]